MTDYAAMAKSNGGEKTWNFNQSKPGQWILRLGTGTLFGICWAVTIEWMIGAATGKPIKDEVGSDGNINKASYKALINMQNMARGTRTVVENGLLQHKAGLSLNGSSVGESVLKQNYGGGSKGPGLSKYFSSKLHNHFAMILISPNTTSTTCHQLGAFLPKSSELKFFDANEGEFTFPNNKRTEFCNFVGAYMKRRYGHWHDWKIHTGKVDG